jgi:hypothetical protein
VVVGQHQEQQAQQGHQVKAPVELAQAVQGGGSSDLSLELQPIAEKCNRMRMCMPMQAASMSPSSSPHHATQEQ